VRDVFEDVEPRDSLPPEFAAWISPAAVAELSPAFTGRCAL
jgi:hypothetical protein